MAGRGADRAAIAGSRDGGPARQVAAALRGLGGSPAQRRGAGAGAGREFLGLGWSWESSRKLLGKTNGFLMISPKSVSMAFWWFDMV